MSKSIIYCVKAVKNIHGFYDNKQFNFTKKIPDYTYIVDAGKIHFGFICTNSILYTNPYCNINKIHDKIKSNYDNESKRTSHQPLDMISEEVKIDVYYPLFIRYHYVSTELINHAITLLSCDNFYEKNTQGMYRKNALIDEYQIIGNNLCFNNIFPEPNFGIF